MNFKVYWRIFKVTKVYQLVLVLVPELFYMNFHEIEPSRKRRLNFDFFDYHDYPDFPQNTLILLIKAPASDFVLIIDIGQKKSPCRLKPDKRILFLFRISDFENLFFSITCKAQAQQANAQK